MRCEGKGVCFEGEVVHCDGDVVRCEGDSVHCEGDGASDLQDHRIIAMGKALWNTTTPLHF